MCRIFCHSSAVIPIKSYSPELMVNIGFDDPADTVLLDATCRWLKTLTSLVIGCGLGREDKATSDNFKYIVGFSAGLKNLVHVIDADGLYHFASSDISFEAKKLILTPNNKEFKRLYSTFLGKEANEEVENQWETAICVDNLVAEITEDEIEKSPKLNEVLELASKLNQIVVRKGMIDIISDGSRVVVVGCKGSLKRTGGLGDILAGIIGTISGLAIRNKVDLIDAVAFSCALQRKACFLGYSSKKIGFTAPNAIEFLTETVNDFVFSK